MRYRKLPKTDLMISEVSFGCMSLSEDSKENSRLLLSAFDQGINYFDTADIYQGGQNEKFLGRALSSVRDQVIIATKVGNQSRADGNGWDWNPTKEYILGAVEKSLKRLQTDYIDLYQLHGGTIEDLIDESIEAFEILKTKGMIRHYGISSIRPNVIRQWAHHSNIVSNMMQYSLLDRRPEEDCFEVLGKAQVGVMVRGALAKGLLVGKPAQDHLGHSKQAIEHLNDVSRSISGRSLTSIALNFALSRPEVTSAVVGIRNSQHLREAISALNTPPLSHEELQKLREAIDAKFYKEHR